MADLVPSVLWGYCTGMQACAASCQPPLDARRPFSNAECVPSVSPAIPYRHPCPPGRAHPAVLGQRARPRAGGAGAAGGGRGQGGAQRGERWGHNQGTGPDNARVEKGEGTCEGPQWQPAAGRPLPLAIHRVSQFVLVVCPRSPAPSKRAPMNRTPPLGPPPHPSGWSGRAWGRWCPSCATGGLRGRAFQAQGGARDALVRVYEAKAVQGSLCNVSFRME